LDPTAISFRLLANERGFPSLAGKSDFGGNARTSTALILLVGILVSRGKFQILAAKETAYVAATHLIVWHPRRSAANAPVMAIW